MEEKTIFELQLHERQTVRFANSTYFEIMRVSGGWIYELNSGSGNTKTVSAVFVPFDRELDIPTITIS